MDKPAPILEVYTRCHCGPVVKTFASGGKVPLQLGFEPRNTKGKRKLSMEPLKILISSMVYIVQPVSKFWLTRNKKTQHGTAEDLSF